MGSHDRLAASFSAAAVSAAAVSRDRFLRRNIHATVRAVTCMAGEEYHAMLLAEVSVLCAEASTFTHACMHPHWH